MHTILVPVDGSIHALKALHIACDLAEKYDGRVALLHVLAEGRRIEELLDLASASAFGPKLMKQLQDAAGQTGAPASMELLEEVGLKILNHAAAKTHRRGIEVEMMPITTGIPSENILIALKTTGASTIVMGSRGETNSDENAFGSVSNAVFRKANCTCLSVK